MRPHACTLHVPLPTAALRSWPPPRSAVQVLCGCGLLSVVVVVARADGGQALGGERKAKLALDGLFLALLAAFGAAATVNMPR